MSADTKRDDDNKNGKNENNKNNNKNNKVRILDFLTFKEKMKLITKVFGNKHKLLSYLDTHYNNYNNNTDHPGRLNVTKLILECCSKENCDGDCTQEWVIANCCVKNKDNITYAASLNYYFLIHIPTFNIVSCQVRARLQWIKSKTNNNDDSILIQKQTEGGDINQTLHLPCTSYYLITLAESMSKQKLFPIDLVKLILQYLYVDYKPVEISKIVENGEECLSTELIDWDFDNFLYQTNSKLCYNSGSNIIRNTYNWDLYHLKTLSLEETAGGIMIYPFDLAKVILKTAMVD